MQKINLLFIITKLELGGAQKQLLSLIEHLDRERFNLFLFTAQEGLLVQDASAIKRLVLTKSKYLERAINPLKDLLAFIEIYRFIKKNKIHIVHTHSSKAGILGRIAARFARIKYIIHTVHGWSFNDYQLWLSRRFFLELERLSGRFSDRLVVVSSYDRQKGIENRIGYNHKYNLIRYGINYSEFQRNESATKIKEELGIGDKDLVITNISCFKPQKSLLDFIKLAALVKHSFREVKFLLVGEGVLRQDIERLILQLNLEKEVILTGWRRDIPAILSATDVLVLTSLWEGLPIVVLEAMTSACPVVATSCGGISEVIVEGKTGFLVEPSDINKMYEKLIILLKDGVLRKTLGKNAKDSLDSDFSLDQMVNRYQNLYKNLIIEKGGENVN